MTFKECLLAGIQPYADVLVTISDNASKEYSIEQTLDKMFAEWEECMLDLTPYKKTG